MAEYDALMRGWNAAHKKEDDITPPTPEWWAEQQARIAGNADLTGTVAS